MTTLWDWLIERHRAKQMAVWRKSVDQAETMAIRLHNASMRTTHPITRSEYMTIFREIVAMHRNEPGRPVDFDKAEEVAEQVLAEMRGLET